jgi:hypothetical protein
MIIEKLGVGHGAWGRSYQCPIPTSQCPIPNSQFPIPNSQKLHPASGVEFFIFYMGGLLQPISNQHIGRPKAWCFVVRMVQKL